MIKHKSIEILKSFSPDEFLEFDKFINSPFFNKSAKVILLYKILQKYRNSFSKDDFTKEFVFSKMKLNKEYNDSTMRNMLSDLYIILRKYLTFVNQNSDKDLQNLAFLKELNIRNIKQKIELGIEAKFNPENYENLNFNNFMISFEHKMLEYRLIYLNTGKFKKENIKLGESLLNDGIFYLLNFLTYRLILAENDLIVLNNSFSTGIEESSLHKLYLLFKDFEFEKIFENNNVSLKFMKLYFLITNSFLDLKNFDKYLDFKKQFDILKLSLPPRIEYDLCKFAVYYNEYKIISNADEESIYDAFYFVKLIVDKKLYLFSDAKKINYFMFRSAVYNGLNNKEYQWVKNFIVEHSGDLHSDYRNNIVNLSWGNYFYSLNNYSDALKNLNEFKSVHRVFNVEAKVLNIKILYDSGNFESLNYSLDTFYKLVKSEYTFGESYKVFLMNFFKYLKKIILCKFNPNKLNNLEFTLRNLKNDKQVVNKLWLIEKYKEQISINK